MAVKTYQDSKDKYLKEKVDTFVLRVPKGKKDEIMEYAKSKGMSLNGYITDLIFSDMGQPIEKAAPVSKPKATEEASAKPKATKVQEKVVEKPQEKTVEKPQEPTPESKKKAMPSFLL